MYQFIELKIGQDIDYVDTCCPHAYPVGFEMLKLVASGQELLCPVVQGPGLPCVCPGAYPGALFSVVVWTSARSPYRSESNRSASSRSANNSSWSASRSANNSKRPVRPGRERESERNFYHFYPGFTWDAAGAPGSQQKE